LREESSLNLHTGEPLTELATKNKRKLVAKHRVRQKANGTFVKGIHAVM
jgi:hypothetical protein